MKCVVFVSEKMGAVPIAECGGVTLEKGMKLLVEPKLAAQMQRHYGRLIIVAGFEEKAKLSAGFYEMGKSDIKAVVHAAIEHGHESLADEQSSDKSMQGKMSKVRRK